MHCPRLDHFVRLQPDKTIGKCGHMVQPRTFNSFNEMQESPWLQEIRKKMKDDIWPDECIRCKKTEEINQRSIRLDMIERDKLLKVIRDDYIIVGGVLDNICNSACQTCNANLSSRIGSLSGTAVKVNNYEKFKTLPLDRILELDINGGEPTYSPNYKKILDDLPPGVKIVRLNTNAHRTFDKVIPLLEKNIRVIITISFDGLDRVHDYVRWPIRFEDVENTINDYKTIQKKYPRLLRLNLWTTVSVYNIAQFDDILSYADEKEIDHGFGILEGPKVLSISNSNALTEEAKSKFSDSKHSTLKNLSKKIAISDKNSAELIKYITQQDMIRSIKFKDYFNFEPNLL